MKCPRCARNLQVVSVGRVRVDACQDGCGGIWFDALELEKMDDPEESAGWLLENMRVDIGLSVDLAKPVNCPRCEGVALMRQKYPSEFNILIDKCRVCGGIWLDFGELFGIRSSKPAPAEATADFLRGLRAESA